MQGAKPHAKITKISPFPEGEGGRGSILPLRGRGANGSCEVGGKPGRQGTGIPTAPDTSRKARNAGRRRGRTGAPPLNQRRRGSPSLPAPAFFHPPTHKMTAESKKEGARHGQISESDTQGDTQGDTQDSTRRRRRRQGHCHRRRDGRCLPRRRRTSETAGGRTGAGGAQVPHIPPTALRRSGGCPDGFPRGRLGGFPCGFPCGFPRGGGCAPRKSPLRADARRG